MAPNPYEPPDAKVADVLPKAHVSWGRLIWLQAPVFFGLLLIVMAEWDALLPGIMGWGAWSALLFSSVLLFLPIRALRNLSEVAAPWWWDVLYYATVLMCVWGIVRGDENIVVAGGAPTVLMLGVTTAYACVVEWKMGVRVYISGRRYLFSAMDSAE